MGARARPGSTVVEPCKRSVLVGGDSVGYRVGGEGEPLVLVHGLSGSSRWWARNVPALVERHRVYLVDLPGFGSLGRLHRRFALHDAAGWLHRWMQAVGLERANLVGHSMGGYIAVNLAADRPDAVDRLVLVAPAGVPSGRSLLGHLIPTVTAASVGSPRAVPYVLLDAARASPRATWRAARALLAANLLEHARRVTAPTLLIWGANDVLVPPSLAPALRAAIPHARLVILPRGGHTVMFDRPDAFNDALRAFLDGARVGA